MSYLHEQLCDLKIEMQIAYLVDIFGHLNQLNLQLQGSGNVKLEGSANIFIFEDKLRAFFCKINLWIDKIQLNNYIRHFQLYEFLLIMNTTIVLLKRSKIMYNVT